MTTAWWKQSVVYQIYPRSFYDSNGDGIGDIPGITRNLDYLKTLGVDVVWLSPVYRSPNDDGGYDISDYRDILPEFGTLADWEDMVDGMHRRGIRLVMDLVVNHTSDEHPWFIEARKSKDNPYRDFYIWRPGRPASDGKSLREPTNWRSYFRGSTWEFDPATQEYYLHLFTRKQPDLNWENPRVRAEVYDMMRWWAEKGVDGFRMDVINLISKVPGFPDAPVSDPRERYQWGGDYFTNGPRLLEYLHEMKREVLDPCRLFSVGETPAVSTRDAVAFTHEETGPLNLVFQFEHMDLDAYPDGHSRLEHRPVRLTDLKRVMSRWQEDLEGKGWNSLYLNNHDQPRCVSRFGDDARYRVESAKMLAIFLHMQKGTPFIYQGEEIGMTNVAFQSIDDYRDVETLNIYREMVREKGVDPKVALESIRDRSRDNARTPLQWDASDQAGFSSGTPWIRVNPNYPQINIRRALEDPESIFYTYQRLIRLRKELPVLVHGRYRLILPDHEQIYAFLREWKDEKLLVILNFSAERPEFTLPPEIAFTSAERVIGNYPAEAEDNFQQITLRPYEARVYFLRGAG